MAENVTAEPGVGHLLAALAAAVPPRGRILELGTDAGVGTAWLVWGLGGRTDVRVTSVEKDAEIAQIARRGRWPTFVSLMTADVLEVFPRLGRFHLVFADAQGGKWEGLERTIEALVPGGVLVVDDMTPRRWWGRELRAKQARVRETLLGHRELVAAELAFSSGMILAVRHRSSTG